MPGLGDRTVVKVVDAAFGDTRARPVSGGRNRATESRVTRSLPSLERLAVRRAPTEPIDLPLRSFRCPRRWQQAVASV